MALASFLAIVCHRHSHISLKVLCLCLGLVISDGVAPTVERQPLSRVSFNSLNQDRQEPGR